MGMLKKIFKDDEKIIGLSGFKKEYEKHFYSFEPKFNAVKLVYSTNTNKNLFIL